MLGQGDIRNRSWPAVSQICNLMRLPSSSIVRILKSMLHARMGENRRGVWRGALYMKN